MPSITINWHMIERCNYRCIFCFSRYSAREELCRNICMAKRLLRELYDFFADKYWPLKISITGGEPFLCKNLGDIVKISKEMGYIVSIITNGSLITKDWLNKYGEFVDWIGISIDSMNEQTELKLGRGHGNHVANTVRAVDIIRTIASHIRIKINTVVTKINYEEDLSPLIRILKPERWKVFQVVVMKDTPTSIREKIEITEKEFLDFVKRHEHLGPIAETCEDTRDSYIMIDPYGRFYSRTKDNTYKYSQSILNAGVAKAFYQVDFDYKKFLLRGGDYNLFF